MKRHRCKPPLSHWASFRVQGCTFFSHTNSAEQETTGIECFPSLISGVWTFRNKHQEKFIWKHFSENPVSSLFPGFRALEELGMFSMYPTTGDIQQRLNNMDAVVNFLVSIRLVRLFQFNQVFHPDRVSRPTVSSPVPPTNSTDGFDALRMSGSFYLCYQATCAPSMPPTGVSLE